MRILHVCESLIVGPASYLEEILPYQIGQFGAGNIDLLVPACQREHIASSIDCGVNTYVRTGRSIGSFITLAIAIRKCIRRIKPDVIHLHSSIAGVVGRLAVLGMHKPPRVVYCAHCWSFDRPRQTLVTRVRAALERMLSGLADAIVNISHHEEPLLQKAGFSLTNTRLIVSGMKDLTSPFTKRATAARPAGAPLRLLFVGRFDVQKGVDILLREYALLKPGRANLTLIGDKIVDKLDLVVPPEVQVFGWVPREQLPVIFNEFDAIVMPSRWEGMPLLAIEALRSGLPLICSSHGAFPYFIEDRVNGILIDIEKPGCLDKALTILENSDLSGMGAAARATYVAMFEQEPMNRDLVGLYNCVAGQQKNEPGLMAQNRIKKGASDRTGGPPAISGVPQ